MNEENENDIELDKDDVAGDRRRRVMGIKSYENEKTESQMEYLEREE